MDDAITRSPLDIYVEHCRRGELAYQVCEDDGRVIFFPRVISPGTGSPKLTWRVSQGIGTVYATTTVYRKDQTPYNVAIIDVDEGFHMMSRVEDIDPEQVKVGMRVKVRMHTGDEKNPPYPVFTPREATK
jgi:uncharacterized protein